MHRSNEGYPYCLRRPVIRIATLVGAWCCGFLFCLVVGVSLGTTWAKCGVGQALIDFWAGCSQMLQARLLAMDIKRDVAGQVIALTLGNREFLSPATKELYRQAGASHILALSGMHLGILYGGMRVVVRRLAYTRWRWVSLLAALWVIWSYALLTGCPLSLVRAAMMLSIALAVQACWTTRRPLDILTLAASLVLLLDPASLFDVGFQMSCAAMFGIIVLGLPWCEFWVKKPYIYKVVLSSLTISFAAQYAVLPLSLYYFKSVACYGAITSLLAIPLSTLVIYASLGLYVGCTWLIPVVEFLLWCQNEVMTYVASLPGAYVEL